MDNRSNQKKIDILNILILTKDHNVSAAKDRDTWQPPAPQKSSHTVQHRCCDYLVDGEVNTKPCLYKQDLVAQVTTVAKHLVPNNQLTGKTMAVSSTHGNNQEYLIADVIIEVNSHKEYCEVAISDALTNVDVVVGEDMPFFNAVMGLAVDRGKYTKIMVAKTRRQAQQATIEM